MSDIQIRELERQLATNPNDLAIRQQLLSAYLRRGDITRKTLGELAVLRDSGAIELLGGKPAHPSVSKKFYLLCGLAAFEKSFSIWMEQNPSQFFMNQQDYTLTLDSLQTAHRLLKHYIETGKIISSRILAFAPPHQANVRELAVLLTRYGTWKSSPEAFHGHRNIADALEYLCFAMGKLCAAVRSNPKKMQILVFYFLLEHFEGWDEIDKTYLKMKRILCSKNFLKN